MIQEWREGKEKEEEREKLDREIGDRSEEVRRVSRCRSVIANRTSRERRERWVSLKHGS